LKGIDLTFADYFVVETSGNITEYLHVLLFLMKVFFVSIAPNSLIVYDVGGNFIPHGPGITPDDVIRA